MSQYRSLHGRGVASNPANRFEEIHVAPDEDMCSELEKVTTTYLRDSSQTIINSNDSPDLSYHKTLNPYRGCEHGCIYCYARPTHEYLGFSTGLDFETKIMVKQDAPALLRKELSSKKWKPETISMSGVTDPYQPIERKLKLTRLCLQVLAEFRNPVTIITKNQLVVRDLDVISQLASFDAAAVVLSITSLESSLTNVMEPRTSRPQARLEAIRKLSRAGVKTCVAVSPIIPGLNDHELPSILKAASEAGAKHAFYVIARLPFNVKTLFEEWLEVYFPNRKHKILSQLRDMHGGKLYQADFGKRLYGQGTYAKQISEMFHIYCRKYGLEPREPVHLSAKYFRSSTSACNQMELGFDS